MHHINNFPAVSVIVTAKNEEDTIESCILSIMEQTYPNFELIFVDAISSDKTFEKANRLKNVAESTKNCKRYIAVSKKAETPARGRNLGAEISNGSILAFTDADCMAEKDWLENLVLHMSPEIGIVGGPNVIRHTRKSKITTAIDSVLATYIGSGGSPQFYQINKDRDVYVVSSCNMAIQKSLFEREGGFDESLRFNEDSEFCNRLVRKGNRIFYTPAAKINHFIGIETYSQFVSYFYKYGLERGKNASKNYHLITKFNALSLAIMFTSACLILLSFISTLYFTALVLLITIFAGGIFVISLKIALINKSVLLLFYVFSVFLSLYASYNSGFILSYIFRIK
jgi:Glycosyltransferases, probably involved in cell wall biogenesis